MYSFHIIPTLKIKSNLFFPNFLFCPNVGCCIILKQKINNILQLVSHFPQMVPEISYLKSAVEQIYQIHFKIVKLFML